MALTKITTNVIADSAITADKIANTVTLNGPKIANVQYLVMQDTTVVTKTNGTIWSWGSNEFGQLGFGSAGEYRSSPTQIGSGTNWNLVSVGQYSVLAFRKV